MHYKKVLRWELYGTGEGEREGEKGKKNAYQNRKGKEGGERKELI